MSGVRSWYITLCLAALIWTGGVYAEEELYRPLQTSQGWLQGGENDGVEYYLGIPYAKPPVGDLRWRAPHSAQPWSGVREARNFASPCAQIGNFFATNNADFFDRPFGSEDCLYLNVWAPIVQIGPRPVLVFIHGGAGVYGAASLPLYNGERLAQELGAVFVSINYRLGIFGALHMDALHTDDPIDDFGSFGLLDQIKALDWIQDNISHYSGDANNVTVMGHSAGCVSTWSLMKSPLASGKFHKVICLSGIPLEASADKLKERSQDFINKLKTMPNTDAIFAQDNPNVNPEQLREALYGLSTKTIITAGKGIKAKTGEADGTVLAVTPDNNLTNPVPAIIGSVRNEASMLLITHTGHLEPEKLWHLIHSDWQGLSAGDFFPSLWRSLTYNVAVHFANLSLLNKVDVSASLLAAQSNPVYRYEFSWGNMEEPWRSLFGAYHGLDVPFIFGNFLRETPNISYFSWTKSHIGELERVHRQFIFAFKGFIESKDPSKYSSELEWPIWDQETKYQNIK
jgi:para-nitrobenzyl esterase